MMQRLRGTWLRQSSSVEVITPLSCAPSTDSTFADDPDAMMMLSAVYSSPFATSVLLAVKRASPLTKVTPGINISCSTPCRSFSVISSLRATTACMSMSKAASLMATPYCAASLTVSATSACLQSVFVGMQPLLRQVPPGWSFSNTATCKPLRAAYSAVR